MSGYARWSEPVGGQECVGGWFCPLAEAGGWACRDMPGGQSRSLVRSVGEGPGRRFCPLAEAGGWACPDMPSGQSRSVGRSAMAGLRGPAAPSGEARAGQVWRQSRRLGARRRRRAGCGRYMNRRRSRSDRRGRRSAARRSGTGQPPGFPARGTGAGGPELSCLQRIRTGRLQGPEQGTRAGEPHRGRSGGAQVGERRRHAFGAGRLPEPGIPGRPGLGKLEEAPRVCPQ